MTRMISLVRHVLLALSMSVPALACAQRIQGLPIQPGDTVEAVQAAYGTSEAPQPSQSARKNVTALHLSSRGVWAFFDQDRKVYTIRLEAPFDGDIGGVKIGSTRAFLIETLGQPTRIVQMGIASSVQPEPYLYELGERKARFDFDQNGVIEKILILK